MNYHVKRKKYNFIVHILLITCKSTVKTNTLVLLRLNLLHV
jgi:hypothetical protein